MAVRLRELPSPRLFTVAEVRSFDRALIDVHGVPGIVLMKRAARALLDVARARYAASSLCILCGHGNNAGDGYVLAALARDAGLGVQVIAVGDPARLTGDAARAAAFAAARGLVAEAFTPAAVLRGDLVVDALLGIGAQGPLRAPYGDAVRAINGSGRPVVAVDVPSGLDADTGAVPAGSDAPDAAVRADGTVTFVAIKRGLVTGRGPALCGEVWLDDLGAAPAIHEGGSEYLRYTPAVAPAPRARDAHKGDFGHLLVVGGASGMGGAGLLCAEAALRTGAGLVSLACAPDVVAAALARRPEAMAIGVRDAADLDAPLARARAIVVGPGLARDARSEVLLARTLDAQLPLVVDADALTLLAAAPRPLPGAVLTPHPGEAARLLATSTAAVQRDRFDAARAIALRYGAVALLKGAGTVISDGERCTVIADGNPGMASGGMGDVLAGVIGALLAQGLPAFAAARLGACLHAAAGDRAAAAGGERGLVAGDLMPWLRRLGNGQDVAGAGAGAHG